MKLLIFGSEGFVGQNLIQGLSEKHEIYTADQIEKSSSPNYTQCDITNFDSIESTVGDANVVIHLAAHSLVSSLDGSITNGKVNIIGLLNLLEVCRKKSIPKVIFTSASSLIGEPLYYQVKEDHPAKPKTAYGITKLTSEHYLRLYHELYNIDYVVFRFFNIYGPYQKNGLVPSIYSRIKKGEPIIIFGKGDQIRDYVYIKDVIPFFERAASSNIADNGVYNMGTGKGTSILEIVNMFSKIMNKEPKFDYQPQRPGEIGNFVADTTLLKSTFQNTPKTTSIDGLEQTIKWLEQNMQT